MNKKNLLFSILALSLLACVILVNTQISAFKENINVERYNRLQAEQKLDAEIKNSQRLETQLKDANRKIVGIQSIVNQGQSTASQLKSTVEVTSKENEELKAAVKKLQDELAASQKAATEHAAAATVNTPPMPVVK